VAYFAASVDPPDRNKEFAESLSLDYPVLSDPTKETARAYGVLADAGYASRVTFYIGQDGKILHIDREVKPGEHGAEIAAKLGTLGVAKR
jgi:peroxiredoxin Q/BCP